MYTETKMSQQTTEGLLRGPVTAAETGKTILRRGILGDMDDQGEE